MLAEDLPSGGIRAAVPQAGNDQVCRQTGDEASPDPGDSRDRRTAMLAGVRSELVGGLKVAARRSETGARRTGPSVEAALSMHADQSPARRSMSRAITGSIL